MQHFYMEHMKCEEKLYFNTQLARNMAFSHENSNFCIFCYIIKNLQYLMIICNDSSAFILSSSVDEKTLVACLIQELNSKTYNKVKLSFLLDHHRCFQNAKTTVQTNFVYKLAERERKKARGYGGSIQPLSLCQVSVVICQEA